MSKFGLEHPGVLDAFAHDTKKDIVVLAMYETRPWTGGDQQIFQLQEKLNAYASFLLDGEYAEAYKEFAGKPVQIQLRTRHEPSEQPSPRAALFSKGGSGSDPDRFREHWILRMRDGRVLRSAWPAFQLLAAPLGSVCYSGGCSPAVLSFAVRTSISSAISSRRFRSQASFWDQSPEL